MDDDVWSPEVLDHVAPDVDLAGGPVSRAVQDHPRLRPHQLVRPTNADLLEGSKENLQWFGTICLEVWPLPLMTYQQWW